MISDESEEEYTAQKKKGRKRKFPCQNKVEKKRLLNQNKPHHNYHGVLVEPKEFTAIESCCKKNCFDKLSIEAQEKLFSDFHAFGSFELRSSFISHSVEEVQQKIITVSKESSRRSCTRVYRLNQIIVCKQFDVSEMQPADFYSIHEI